MPQAQIVKRMGAAGAPPALGGLGRWCDRHFKWLLVAPAVALILALSIYPLAFSLVVSFINYYANGSDEYCDVGSREAGAP